MDMKSSFMGGLCLKPAPKIVTKNDTKLYHSNVRHLKKTSADLKSHHHQFNHHSKNSSLNSLNSMIIQNHNSSSNSVLSGNSLNQNHHHLQQNHFNQTPVSGYTKNNSNKTQFLKHTENFQQATNAPSKSISLLRKSPVKMQSLLQKRCILNTMNSNLIANQYNSSNLLINSLMKTTINSANAFTQSEKLNTSTFNDNVGTGSCSGADQTTRVDDKMIKVIKLCVTRLEFSSPLFRRIATKMNFLYMHPAQEHIRNYENFCSTSNKAVLKQVMNKTHTLKYKTSRGRSRMLRSNEIVDGKVMISWQRSSYVHVYTFNRRQRLRRYRQISMDLGFEHRTLQIMYGLKKVTLPKIIDCPFCKKKLNPDLGHYCVVARKPTAVKRLRSSSSVACSLLKKTNQLNDSLIQTSDYVSNESDNSLDIGFNQFKPASLTSRRSCLEDSSKINVHKLSKINDDEDVLKRCPSLLLDSSNYKTNQNSISNLIIRRMDSKELHKKMNRNAQFKAQSNVESASSNSMLQIKKVNASLPVKNNLIKCSVMDQHSNFAVQSMENSIKIVFK